MDVDEITRIARAAMDSVLDFINTTDDFATITNVKKSDVTRRFDVVAEEILERELIDKGINARVISEEFGDRVVGKYPACALIFDPVDGSTNASIDLPYFCSSLAYAQKHEGITLSDVEIGVVVTNFNNVYAAEKGKGASFDGKRLKKTKIQRYKPIISAYSYGVPTVSKGLIELEKKCIVRTLGSVALDLCLVAAGKIDAVIDTRGLVSSYDIAAAQLIVRENDAIITDGNGNNITADVAGTGITFICAADRAFHAKIVKMLTNTALTNSTNRPLK
jgi:fructose-1,6-bisphosphatase/inositol monophosphatase family enzyme